MTQTYTYLDYAASAPLRDVALAAERAYDQSDIAGINPNSLHSLGRKAAQKLEQARKELSDLLGGGFRPNDLYFTSGGTESNNLALLGIAEGVRQSNNKKDRVIISAIEHDSVLAVVPVLRERGFSCDIVRPNRQGVISPEALDALLADDVALVSIMYANNETGIIQPIDELARRAHRVGARMHTDAVQAFGHIRLQLSEVDAVSITAHKLGGPVGIGALAVRNRCPLKAQSFGGGQERGKRAGTQDVRSALAFAATARYCCEHVDELQKLSSRRAQKLYDVLCSEENGVVPTTTTHMDDSRLPGIVSLMVPRLDSETLILQLDQQGFEVSAASACSAGSLEPSHVLTAMGIARNDALGSLRISFDERVSDQDLQRFSSVFIQLIQTLKQ